MRKRRRSLLRLGLLRVAAYRWAALWVAVVLSILASSPAGATTGIANAYICGASTGARVDVPEFGAVETMPAQVNDGREWSVSRFVGAHSTSATRVAPVVAPTSALDDDVRLT